MPWGKARGLGQNGGYVAAIDEKTGDELKGYDVSYDGDMEGDKQDVFVTSLEIDREGRRAATSLACICQSPAELFF